MHGQGGSNRWDESGQRAEFLTATALVGVIVSGLVMVGWWSTASGPVFSDTDIVDQGLHNLMPDECRFTLAPLLSQFRSDPRVLWVWVEESEPSPSSLTTMSAGFAASRDAPRPYAFRPDAAELPARICGHTLNSVHALSLGGAAGPFLEPMPTPWRVGVGP